MPIVEAVGVACGTHVVGSASRAAKIEAAMLTAVQKCQASGITDIDVIQTAIRDARQAVLDDEDR